MKINPNGFREYDARWLYEKEIDLEGITDLGKGLGSQIISHTKKTKLSSETWIVMSGKLKVTFYDIDKSKVYEDVLNKGDISILFSGGHSFKPLSKNTSIFEIKNGPYMGPIKEKENFKSFLNESSLKVIDAMVEPSLISSKPGDRFQFQRLGYFVVDKESRTNSLVFNKTVGLRDTWSKTK